MLAKNKVTAATFTEQASERYKDAADAYLKVYPASSDAEAVESAAALAGDMFIGYGTWKWLDVHAPRGSRRSTAICSIADRPIAPRHEGERHRGNAKDIGARHAGEIEYVFGALDVRRQSAVGAADVAISEQMMSYWTNFAKAGNPNGRGLAGVAGV